MTETETFVLHTHATNFYADALTSTATGALLRQFGSFPSRPAGQPFVALSVPSGDKAYTPAYTRLTGSRRWAPTSRSGAGELAKSENRR